MSDSFDSSACAREEWRRIRERRAKAYNLPKPDPNTPEVNEEPEDQVGLALSGGGLRVGQMVGETDSNAAYPISKPYTPGNVLSTMYNFMGIDDKHHLYDASNRPIPILGDGGPIRELI